MPTGKYLVLEDSGVDDVDHMGIRAWDRQEGETTKAYAAFRHYRDQGPDRTLEKTQKAHSGSVPAWATYNLWTERILAWDRFQQREWERVLRGRAIDRAKRHARLADGLIAKAAEALIALKVEKMTPTEVRQYLETGIKLEQQLYRMNGEDEGGETGRVTVVIEGGLVPPATLSNAEDPAGE